jgi:hypothetical protein
VPPFDKAFFASVPVSVFAQTDVIEEISEGPDHRAGFRLGCLAERNDAAI